LQAYWVSDYLEAPIREHRVQWHSHDGERALQSKLKNFHFNERDPTPEEIDVAVTQLLSANPKSQGIEIYRNNDELPPLSTLFSKAKTRVNILAIDAGVVTKKSYPDFIELLKKGIIVRFVLLDEDAKPLLDEVTKAWPFAGKAFDVLQESLRMLCQIKKEVLKEVPKAKLEIKFVNLLPIHSMIIIDPESEHAFIQVTNYHYNIHSWVSLAFSRIDQPELFQSYLKSYQYVESNITRDYDCKKQSKG